MFTPIARDAASVRPTRAELHFHLLPGVDDGPRDLDESLELARLAVADGTRHVVCTPHVEVVDVATIPGRVRELAAALSAARIALRIEAGSEIRAGSPLTDAELEIVAQGPRERRWVLLEAPLEHGKIDLFHAHAHELEGRGYGLLVGHPERCAELMAAAGGLESLLRHGALLQVNASSLTGAHGPPAREAGFGLVARGIVAAVASDAHGAHRPPLLQAAVRALAARGLDGGPLIEDGPWQLLRYGIAASRDHPAA